MKHLYNIALFVLANAAGFFCVSLTYHFCVALGIFTPNNALLDNGMLQRDFFTGSILVWLVCAVLSLGFFAFREKARLLFLVLPILLPALYGLNVLVRLEGLPG
jgi:hypothetical protein